MNLNSLFNTLNQRLSADLQFLADTQIAFSIAASNEGRHWQFVPESRVFQTTQGLPQSGVSLVGSEHDLALLLTGSLNPQLALQSGKVVASGRGEELARVSAALEQIVAELELDDTSDFIQ